MIFVERIQKIKEKAVLIWLSNGSIQVNFPDCCVLIQNEANAMKPKQKKPLAHRKNSDINIAAEKELNNDSILTE